MDSQKSTGNRAKNSDGLPPPPPVPPSVTPVVVGGVGEPVVKKMDRVPMVRRGPGSKGQKITLLTNHFRVDVAKVDGHFYHYSVSLFYEDGRPIDGKGAGRRIIEKVKDIYKSELAGKDFAYDGEKSLFTVGALPRNKFEFTVVLEEIASNRSSSKGDASPNENDRKRTRRIYRSKTFMVEINFAARIPMKAIANALRGQESENSQEAFRVLDIILRQHAAKQGCLLVRQSFFHNDPKKFTDLGGGVLGCRGFHTSFRTAQGGLSLNIDVSTTMIVRPGPVVDFLLANQNVRDPFSLDWAKAKRALKNLRVKVHPSNTEHKITGLSDKPCKQQLFTLKQRTKDESVQNQSVEITVNDYFLHIRNIKLSWSADLPCINVGKPNRPTYIPLELCELVSLQRYTKALSTFQRAALVEKSRQKPKERMSVLSESLEKNNYAAEPLLKFCDISINKDFTEVEGRVLSAPRLKVGNGEDFFPRNGRWNFNNKRLVDPRKIEIWAVVNFSARCNCRDIVRDLIRCGQMKGVEMQHPRDIIEESPQSRRLPPVARVEKMFEELKCRLRLQKPPEFLLCMLPERKNSELYGPWKRKNLAELGIVTQCMSPMRVNDQYLTNILLKINAKLGGLNSILCTEHIPSIPLVSKIPTLIIGMDVSHGSPGQSDIPSIAAVVSSKQWPLISRYRASVRAQSPKAEMIDSLFQPVPVSNDKRDDGLIREALMDFYFTSGQCKPEHIIIFRDGVSESQFNQVLNIELNQIIEACKYRDETWFPKFTLIVAQKKHHTKFFQPKSPDNVPPGTVIDNKICHPRNNDFYMCAHAGMIGTTRPTHYQVLYDEIGFQTDDLQELVHSLSYVYQRSTTAISVVAPVCYAHLAASQMSQFMKFEESSDATSSRNEATAALPVPQLPKLHANVQRSMFFC